MPRDQRQKELEYYLKKQYNTIGLKLQNRLNSVDKQFQSIPLNKEPNSILNSSRSNRTSITLNPNVSSIIQPAMSGSSATLQSSSTTALIQEH